MKVNIYNGLEEMSIAAADLFVKQAQISVVNNGRFSVALSGGTTPERTFELLAQKPWIDQVPWFNTHIFWGDERCVPKTDLRHNALMAQKLLLNHVPVPLSQIHPLICNKDPKKAAVQYELLLRNFFNNQPVCFDLMMLGLGNDGHTASLFPGTPVLKENKRWVAEVSVPGQDFDRVTLTVPFIERSAMTIFQVAGADKAGILKKVLEGEGKGEVFPAQLIVPSNGELIWLIDKDAGVLLDKEKYK